MDMELPVAEHLAGQGEDIYLCGYHHPNFIAEGLYAGLKHRNGLPTPLPITLAEGEEYVNAGFLDALPCLLVRELELSTVHLHVSHSGDIKISFYLLTNAGRVLHCIDYVMCGSAVSRLSLPVTMLDDPNGRLVFFKIQAASKTTVDIYDWFFSTPKKQWLTDTQPLLLVSRSLGESASLVKRFIKLCQEYIDLKQRYPGLIYLPIPVLKIYESDQDSYQASKALIPIPYNQYITIKYNPRNLGGGGNMCLAIYEEVVKNKKVNQFGMLDSDTILPFRSFYLASLKAKVASQNKSSKALVPVILYASQPNRVLECGSLFGRGNWGIISHHPTQPCIQPLHHREQLNEIKIQATLASGGYTDYPPFIFSIFCAEKHQLASHFLPTPFFLRGDDIEMGQHLRNANIPCQVDGSLVVFQEPKHSLWHEWMAILHGTCLILSYSANEGSASNGFPELERYFRARSIAHARIYDINGLHTYQRILDRLISLLEWPKDEIILRFHDPKAYLAERRLNKPFLSSNFSMLQSMTSDDISSSNQLLQLPFIYFEPDLHKHIDDDSPLPPYIGLINNSLKSAAILEPYSISKEEVSALYDDIQEKSSYLFESKSEELAHRCLLILDRKQIIKHYLSRYPLN